MTTLTAALTNRLDALQKRSFKWVNAYFLKHAGGSSRPVFYDTENTCPALLEFDRNFAAVRAELTALLPQQNAIPRYYDIDHLQAYISGGVDTSTDGIRKGWKVFMLYLMGIDATSNQECCPQTTAILKKIPNLYQAFFSILDPEKSIRQHQGPFIGYLRYHLALQVPTDAPPVLNIKDQQYCWAEGKSVLFDDTWSHDVQNSSKHVRVVLIVDILRPMPLVPHVLNKIVSRFFIKNLYGKKVYKNLQTHGRQHAA